MAEFILSRIHQTPMALSIQVFQNIEDYEFIQGNHKHARD
jgi:hypothetical protein